MINPPKYRPHPKNDRERLENLMHAITHCQHCKTYVPLEGKPTHCPHCGAVLVEPDA